MHIKEALCMANDNPTSSDQVIPAAGNPAPYLQNRELSWLDFNERVLEQGADESVPLLQRLNFISIFWSNLQEFFMVRVGSLQERANLMRGKKEKRENKTNMTAEEQLAAIKYTVDVVNHRVPVIAGAGSNDTDHGCALAAKSAECGADALLMVTPYYNKTTQAGLVAHFTAMAEAGGIPVIMYNVPSRTGLNIAPETALELSKHPLINGIKEASGNISQVAKIAQLCGDELNIYSGNDDQVVPLLALGGKGVISVVSNVKPELVHNCCKAWFDGDTAKARALQLEMLPLCDALFCEVNPIPVKYAMNVLGWEAGECRLPLVEPSDAHKEQIEQACFRLGGADYHAPAQLLGDFLAHRPSAAEGGIRPTYRPGVRLCDLHDALPKKLTDTLEQAMPRLAGLLPGFDAPDALLTAPETRSSSPVRIVRGEDCQSELRGLYPCGEGAGYAGGILSAAVDGMRCAEAVLSQTEDKT